MTLLAGIWVFFALISQIFGFALEPRLSERLLDNNGLDKYNEPASEKLEFHHNKIEGYFFYGDSVFDLPSTLGILFQDYPRGRDKKVVKKKVKESVVGYVFSEKGVLVLGVPRTLEVEPADWKVKSNLLDLAQFLWHHDVEITKTSYKGQNSESTHEVSPLKDILADFQEDGGRVRGAGVVDLNDGLFSGGFNALGVVLNHILGVDVMPWRPTGNEETLPFLFFVTEGQKPTLEMAIGKEVVMLWRSGLDPQYAPTAEATWKWDTDPATIGDDSSFNDCGTDRNSNEDNDQKGPPTAEKLFHIKAGRAHGGCDPSRQKTITTWLSESRELAKAGLQAFSDADDGDKIAIHTLKQFLGIDRRHGSKERLKTKKWLEEVSEFFDGELKLPSGTPMLFCGSTWLDQKTWDDDSLDYDGDVKFSDDNNPLKLKDDASHAEYLKTETADGLKPTDLIPYWSSDLKQYSFQRDFENKGYCQFTGNLAGTEFNTNPIAVELCPKAFSYSKGSTKLGGKSGTSVALADVCPRSGTLLHEVFHVVHGETDSPDATYDLDVIRDALRSPKKVPKTVDLEEPDDTENARENDDKLTNLDLIRQNPETWVFFCVSYWYTLNKKVYFPFDGNQNAMGVPTSSS